MVDAAFTSTLRVRAANRLEELFEVQARQDEKNGKMSESSSQTQTSGEK
tara:strand:+ start:140 stop:286 length:147 start_codon:yes stop_codon:yes gene_type:complete